MRFLRFRQFILGFFLAIALLFAFEAGERGVEYSRNSLSKTHQKPFKSFPLFNGQSKNSVPGDIQTQNTQEQVRSTEETKKTEEKKEEEKKSTPTSQNENWENSAPTQSKQSGSQELPLGASRTDSFGVVISTEKASDTDLASRKKTLPPISDLYVPVYLDQNLTASVISDFYSRFPQESPKGKLYVLGSEAPSGNGDTSYEILVYENQGAQFKGAFTTSASSQFPFQGLPTFESRQPARFQESVRLLVFSDTQANLQPLLSEEAHVQAILKSAYRSNPDPQTFVGTDFQWNVDIYHVFPGIFTAQPLR